MAALPFYSASSQDTNAATQSVTAESPSAAGTTPESVIESVATPVPTYPKLDEDYESGFEPVYHKSMTGRVAFSANVGGLDRVFVLDLDARRVRVLIDGPGNNSYPSWSPNGDKVVFTSDRDGNKEIYVADWAGLNQKRLTATAVNEDNASFSPNGEEVVYYADAVTSRGGKPPTSNIFRVAVSGARAPVKITNFKQRNTTPRWSPDGRRIAYSTDRFWPGWDVCIWDLEARKEACVLSGAKTYCRPAWSETGDMIAYSAGLGDEIDLGVYDYASRTLTVLTTMENSEYDAVWLDSKKSLLFVSDQGSKGKYNIYKVDIATKAVSPVLKSRHSIRFISWNKKKTLELEAARIRDSERKVDAADSALPEISDSIPALEKTLFPE